MLFWNTVYSSETYLLAIIFKTVNRSVSCQGGFKLNTKGAFQKM